MTSARRFVHGLLVGSLSTALLLAMGCAPVPVEHTSGIVAAHPVRWGVFLPDNQSDSSALPVVVQMAQSSPQYMLRFAAIDDPVPVADLSSIQAAGAQPVLTLEIWQPGAGVEQPAYASSRVAVGDFDDRLDRWARELAAWGGPVTLRVGHEMNAPHYPWSVGVNGNTAADSVAAWKHIRERFARAGADRVSFMWCPDATAEGADAMAAAFPGVDSVDVLGLDGYNWGEDDGHTWQAADQIFGDALDRLRRLDGEHDIVIAETASAEGPQSGVDKADWIYGLFDFLATQERVRGLIWFQAEKERDWRFNSSPQAQEAFKQSVAKHAGD
ncbi:hypothetical protein H7I41_03910 [Mycobacterium manitobense]|uniref:GH26 domain-containing protein n=1 Tax=[Mycobacterium] manitobense TaxID=190147 RepID=A0A9X2YL13_9MYCO|nr:glycosyl hydrolase [[Mycobacterium] manitobense]MCV7169069.1 hypothetical protein [[Mycobacterium] manitobense]